MKKAKSFFFVLALGALLASCGEPPVASSDVSSSEDVSSVEESSIEESSVEESSVEESSSEPLAPATPIAEFRSSVETGAKVDLEGIVVAHRYNGQGTPYINGFYMTDGVDTVAVYGEETAKAVKVGEKVRVTGEKGYYIPSADQGSAAAMEYKGQLQLCYPTLVYQDGQTHEIPEAAISAATASEIKAIPLSTDITGKLYRVKGYYGVAEGGVSQDPYTNYSLYDLDRMESLFHYSTSSGKDFAWTKQYDGKAVDMLVTIVLAKPSGGGWRFAPVSCYGEITVPAKDEASYALKRLEADIPLYHEAAVNLTIAKNDPFDNAERVVTASDENVAITEDAEGIHIALPSTAVGTHELNLKVTYEGEVAEKKVNLVLDGKPAIATTPIADAIAAEDGTEVVVEGIVVGAVKKSGANQSVFIADATGSIRVFAGTATMPNIADLAQGNACIIKATKTHYKKSTVTSNYEGDLELTDPEVLWQDHNENDIPTSGMAKISVSDIANGTLDNNLTGKVYRISAMITKLPNAYGEVRTMIDPADQDVMIPCYSQSSGSDYSWLYQYDDRQAQNFLVGVVDNNSSSGCKYRAVPLAVEK